MGGRSNHCADSRVVLWLWSGEHRAAQLHPPLPQDSDCLTKLLTLSLSMGLSQRHERTIYTWSGMERSWTGLDLVTAAVVGELVASGLATAAAGSNASTARAE